MRPETYSSLKAVHGAWRVALGYMHRQPIDVMRQVCPACGQELDVMGMNREREVVCPACHGVLKLPGHVVGAVKQRRAAEEIWEVDEAESWVVRARALQEVPRLPARYRVGAIVFLTLANVLAWAWVWSHGGHWLR